MTEPKVLPWREGWAGCAVLVACRGGVSQWWLGVVGLHLLGLFRGERLLGGPGGASAAALRRAGPSRHLGMLPDAWRLETVRAGGEVGERRRPVVFTPAAGVRFPVRRDFTGEA